MTDPPLSSSSSSSSSVMSALVVDSQYILHAREIYAPYTNDDLYRQVAIATVDSKDASKFLKLLTERMNLSQYGVINTIYFVTQYQYACHHNFFLVHIYTYIYT